jgi:O-antigen/teichoic acid export membrane protein
MATSSYATISLGLIEGIVFVPLYLHFIGGLLYAAWLATGSIISYLGLLDLGFNSVIAQKVAEASGAKDVSRLQRYVGSGLAVVGLYSFLPFLMGLLVYGQLWRVVPVSQGQAQILGHAFLLASLSASLMLAVYARGAILCALQWQVIHGIIVVVAQTLGIVVTLALLLSGLGLISIPIGALTMSTTALVGEIVGFRHLRRKLLPHFSLLPEWRTVKELLKPATMMFLTRGGSTLVRQSDNLLIGIVLDARAVLLYALTQKASSVLTMLVGHSVGSFAPALAHFFGSTKQRLEDEKSLTANLIHVTLVFSLVSMGGYYIFNRFFMHIWVGPSYYAGDLVVLLLTIYSLIQSITLVLFQIVFAKGRFIPAALSTGLEAILRIPLTLLLVRWYGLPGVGLAAILSLCASGLWILGRQYVQDFPNAIGAALSNVGLVAAGVVAFGAVFLSVDIPESIGTFVVKCFLYVGCLGFWVFLVDRKSWTATLDLLKANV